jgi:hypothetical protein
LRERFGDNRATWQIAEFWRNKMTEWKPMNANPFPWEHTDVVLAAYDKDNPNIIDLFRCTCAEHGAYFSKSSNMLSIIEEGWIPFAWREDDTPSRDDEKFPPMLTDYLTGEI